MIIATHDSSNGSFDRKQFVGNMAADLVGKTQADALSMSLADWDVATVKVEKAGRRVYVTVVTHRNNVWSWTVGALGKTTAPCGGYAAA